MKLAFIEVEQIKKNTVSACKLGEILNLSERQIQRLASNKILPRCARGQYDLISTVQAYIRYQKENGSLAISNKAHNIDAAPRITDAIVILLRCRLSALNVLLGRVKSPGPDEIAEAIQLKKTPITTTEMFFEIIEQAGGWSRIVRGSKLWIQNNWSEWSVFKTYFIYSGRPYGRLNGKLAESIASKYGITKDKAKRIIKTIPEHLTESINMIGNTSRERRP
jgi:hypothetical protein